MAEGQVFWATPMPREEEEPQEPKFNSEIEYMDWLWQQPSKPDRLRFMAAAEVAKYRNATMRAVAHIPNKDSLAASLDRARERSNLARVIKLELKALPPQHPAV